jgi:hypothetical protein
VSHPFCLSCLPWLQVKGLLLESEVELAKKEYYLKGAHVVVGACTGLSWRGQSMRLGRAAGWGWLNEELHLEACCG